MPLVTSKELFEKAYKGGYAIGAFNVISVTGIDSRVRFRPYTVRIAGNDKSLLNSMHTCIAYGWGANPDFGVQRAGARVSPPCRSFL